MGDGELDSWGCGESVEVGVIILLFVTMFDSCSGKALVFLDDGVGKGICIFAIVMRSYLML